MFARSLVLYRELADNLSQRSDGIGAQADRLTLPRWIGEFDLKP
jgi:hypothetical protein